MIYEHPSPDEPIRQGDIFRLMPRLEYSLNLLMCLEEDGPKETTWLDLATSNPDGEAVVLVRMKPIYAMVINQDCDTSRSQYITLCQIGPFREIEPKCKAVNFLSVTKADLEGLESLRSPLRMGRLYLVATEHFRERVSEFFRRYPYDEWYPLN